jgi:hypothetical protein
VGVTTRVALLVAGSLLAAAVTGLAAPNGPALEDRFREANAHVRGRDYPKAVGIYRELAVSGSESASLYWNWAQAAAARGAAGEALWALLRGRELDPGDRALPREIERLREAANLDPAEIAPEPLAVVARLSRRFHLGLVALVLAVASLALHAASRLRWGRRGLVPAAWVCLALALAVSTLPVAGSYASALAVVVTRGAPLIGSASPTAEVLGSLREGEVVPVLERSGDYLRIEDSSGARGWTHAGDVWPLEAPRTAQP